MKSKFYTGIGSRATPPSVISEMVRYAINLAKKGYTLRTGGADGADTAFELGATSFGGKAEIYLPWNTFNGSTSVLYPETLKNWSMAECIASEFHPNWSNLSQGARKMHTRNVYQVLGKDLDTPSKFVICWTPVECGVPMGGTSQAIRIANEYDIPVYNIYEHKN